MIVQVIFVDKLESMTPCFESIGPAVECHASFPEGVNVEFVEVSLRDQIYSLVGSDS